MTRWHPPPRPINPPTVHLTERQADVLALLCLGYSNAEIGRRLLIAENSVKTHCKRIYIALGADGRAHAAVLACLGHVLIEVNENGRSAA